MTVLEYIRLRNISASEFARQCGLSKFPLIRMAYHGCRPSKRVAQTVVAASLDMITEFKYANRKGPPAWRGYKYLVDCRGKR